MSAYATANEQGILCACCDMRNAAGNAYCVGCGAQLGGDAPLASPVAAARKQRCGMCGITNPAGAVYCVICGVSLADSGLPSHAPAHGPPAAGASNGAFVQHIYIAAPVATAEPPLIARALWFVFVGLWVGQIWLILAWLINLTVIGLPLGMWMLNRMPQVMTLRTTPYRPTPARANGAGLVVRAVYFVLIGWWVSFLWMELAWLAAMLVIGLPLSFQMFERVDTVMTLSEI